MCSRPVPRGPLRRVAVTGSTHGNEMSGVLLVQHWRRAPEELQRPSFSALPVLANPRAAAACRRYVDLDLNRAFISTFLTARPQPDDPYEVTRARELNQLLGPKASSQAFDFVLDLHNTTANMGACFICNNADNVFTMHLCRYLQVPLGPRPPVASPLHARTSTPASVSSPEQAWALTQPLRPQLQNPETLSHVYLYQKPEEDSYSVDSLGRNGMGLELGPQPQGVLRADLFTQMRTLVAQTLDFIELFNKGTTFPAFEMEAYRALDHVDFPRTEAGELAGAVHPRLQDRDFEALRPGEPIFQMFSGEDVLYRGGGTVYPVFINEAAYYEKGIAFISAEKLRFSVPALPVLAPAP